MDVISRVNGLKNKDGLFWVKWLLRIGVFCTFLGHGMIAFSQNEDWLPYLATVGITGELALSTMKMIGGLDILIAIAILIKPWRPILYWCVFWTFATASIRPISGESILQFIERGANWTVPLVLLILSYRFDKSHIKSISQSIKS